MVKLVRTTRVAASDLQLPVVQEVVEQPPASPPLGRCVSMVTEALWP